MEPNWNSKWPCLCNSFIQFAKHKSGSSAVNFGNRVTRIEKPKISQNPKKIKKMAFEKTSQKNDTLRPAKRGSRNAAPHIKNDTLWPAKRDIFLTNFDAIFWSSWHPLYVKVLDHFGSKLVTILIQSWWPFWFKVGGHFGLNLWHQFWPRVLRTTQCYKCLV